MHGHIHVHGIVWSLGIILSTLIYDDLVKSLIKRMQLFYVIKEELKIANICWLTRLYTPHTFKFIKLQSYGSLLHPFAVSTWIFDNQIFLINMSVMSCTY